MLYLNFFYFFLHNFTMDLYQKLWQQKIPNNQMVVDWDTFIQHFSKAILDNASVSLSDTHKKYISGIIDPEHRNQVYKNAYLLFIKNFWSIPSNRTKFLSMKMNLSGIVSRVEADQQSQDRLQLQIKWKNQENESTVQKYLVTPKSIKKCNIQNKNSDTKTSQKLLLVNQFISIGADSKNDIVIDSIHINEHHIKIIHKKLPKKVKKSFFDKKKVQQTSPWHIRDNSRSSRLKLVMNSFQNQYLVLKTGLQFQIGILKQYLVTVKNCPLVAQGIIDNLQLNLNSDRFDIYGNQSKPVKDIINFNLKDLSPTQVAELFEMESYYPSNDGVFQKQNNQHKLKDEGKANPITISILHKPTLKSFQFNSKIRIKFWIGRKQSSEVLIDSICIRDYQCLLENINGAWILRANDVHVYLASQSQMKSNRNANRHTILQSRQQIYACRQFQMKLMVIKPIPEEQF